MKKNVELEKFMSDRTAELAQYEAEMEKRKIDIEMQKAKMAREIRFKAKKKFDGNAADFPVFRRRIRDNLEDGLLSDAQKIEFLPKFVSGEAYDVVARSAGCSYEDIVANLEDRYGQPATVAAACTEKLTG